MLPKPQISRCQNKSLCNDSSILVLVKEIILKWVEVPDFGRDRWKNEAKYRKWSFSQSLSKELF